VPEQQQLFPTDRYEAPDPWKMHPDEWTKQSNVMWHGNAQKGMVPRVDRTSIDYVDVRSDHEGHVERLAVRRPAPRADKLGGYGYEMGMHLGTPLAASQRISGDEGQVVNSRLAVRQIRREQTHPDFGITAVRVHEDAAEQDDEYNKVLNDQYLKGNAGRNDDNDMVFSDDAANYERDVNALVLRGKAVKYINSQEDRGSNSVRVLPEKTSTWSEDVLGDPSAHPLLRHYASLGYEPTVSTHQFAEQLSLYEERQFTKTQDEDTKVLQTRTFKKVPRDPNLNIP
jgi:hypothetical protein